MQDEAALIPFPGGRWGRIYSLALAGLFLFFAVFASPAHAACSNPTGATGQTIYNSSFRNMEYCDSTNWIDMGLATPYIPQAMTFGGATYLSSTSKLTGIADSTQGSISFWFRRDGTSNGVIEHIFSIYRSTTNIRFDVVLAANNGFQVIGHDSSSTAGTTVLNLTSTTTITDTNWHHMILSFDLSNAAHRGLYIDDVAASTTWGVYTNTAIGFGNSTSPNNTVAAAPGGASYFHGDLADLVFAPGVYTDLSTTANRRVFITSSLTPADLGPKCVNVGAVPEVCLTGGTASDWYTNDGFGGGFTLNGTLTAASSRPGYSTAAGGGSLGYTGSCSSPTGTEGEILFSTAYNLMQYCDGLNWIAMGPTGLGGAGCGSPSGTAGEMIFNSAYSVMQYCDGTNWVPMGKDYFANAVAFDGSASTYTKDTAMPIPPATSQFTVSAWVYFNTSNKLDTGASSGTSIFDADSMNDHVDVNAGDDGTLNNGKVEFDVYVKNSSGTTLAEVISNPITVGAWHHLLYSVDVAAGVANMYVDDVSSVSYVSSIVNGTIDFTARWESPNNSTAYALAGDLADVWAAPGVYLDFSQVANRRKFRDDSGRPVYLGANGEYPTGSPPALFLSGPTASWGLNSGTGGTWTVTGTMTTAPTFPP